jgi:hypothetical protein
MRYVLPTLAIIPVFASNVPATEPPVFKQVMIESLPQGWGYAHKTLTADGKIRGGHLSGGPDAPRVYDSEEQCKAADLKMIIGLVSDVLEAGRKRKPDKEGPPAMDRTKHGYKRASITRADGTTVSFLAKFTEEFEDAKVQAIHKAIAKYSAGAW